MDYLLKFRQFSSDDSDYVPAGYDDAPGSDLVNPAFRDVVVRFGTTVEPSTLDVQIIGHVMEVLNGKRQAHKVPAVVTDVREIDQR